MAADGSCFLPSLRRGGRFTVGPKGEEKTFQSFLDALEHLRGAYRTCWRRPNPAGNWGIVTAVCWVEVEIAISDL